MATNLALEDSLIIEAQKLGHHKTKKDAVTEALTEYIKRKKQLMILDEFGNIEFNELYSYKENR